LLCTTRFLSGQGWDHEPGFESLLSGWLLGFMNIPILSEDKIEFTMFLLSSSSWKAATAANTMLICFYGTSRQEKRRKGGFKDIAMLERPS